MHFYMSENALNHQGKLGRYTTGQNWKFTCGILHRGKGDHKAIGFLIGMPREGRGNHKAIGFLIGILV